MDNYRIDPLGEEDLDSVAEFLVEAVSWNQDSTASSTEGLREPPFPGRRAGAPTLAAPAKTLPAVPNLVFASATRITRCSASCCISQACLSFMISTSLALVLVVFKSILEPGRRASSCSANF